jgi:hypothetical protein
MVVWPCVEAGVPFLLPNLDVCILTQKRSESIVLDDFKVLGFYKHTLPSLLSPKQTRFFKAPGTPQAIAEDNR